MKDIFEFFEKQGFSTPDRSFYKAMELWEAYYTGDVDNFHSYGQYNGIKMVNRRRRSLNMAKKICEDKADLMLNEKVEWSLPHEESMDFLKDVLDKNNFQTLSNQLLERANALGTCAFVEIFNSGEIVIDYVNGKNIYPLSWEGDHITQCAFASLKHMNGEKYIYIHMHLLEDREYVIKNHLLKYEKGKLIEESVEDILGISETIYTKSPLPFFQIIKPNTANHILSPSPMGISAFSGALDILQGIDTIYDSFINEFDLGKKRIFIDSSLAQVSMGEDGTKLTPVFDTNDICFYGLSGLRESGELIKEVNMELRIEEHISALNANLSLLSAKCGLGRHFYSFEKTGLKTATEVISENSDLFRKIKKDEIILRKALMDLAKAVIYMGMHFLHKNISWKGISVYFDDSIIEDSRKIKEDALTERNAGLISDARYFEETRNMDKDTALAFTKEMNGQIKMKN